LLRPEDACSFCANQMLGLICLQKVVQRVDRAETALGTLLNRLDHRHVGVVFRAWRSWLRIRKQKRKLLSFVAKYVASAVCPRCLVAKAPVSSQGQIACAGQRAAVFSALEALHAEPLDQNVRVALISLPLCCSNRPCCHAARSARSCNQWRLRSGPSLPNSRPSSAKAARSTPRSRFDIISAAIGL
jgi:hypothetical protein